MHRLSRGGLSLGFAARGVVSILGLVAFAGSAVAAPPASPVRHAANDRFDDAVPVLISPDRLPSIVDHEFECADCEHGCAHAKTSRARFLAGLNPDGTPMDSTGSGFGEPISIAGVAPGDTNDLISNDLNIDINPSTGFVTGHNVMRVRSLAPALTTFRFRLQNILPIGGVKVNGNTAAYTRIDSANVDVTLDRAYAVDEQFDVRVDYSGNPQNNGFDSIVFSTQGGQPLAFTLSETNFAYTWWPTKDDNFDKSTANLRFTIPSTMAIASQGTLQSITPAGTGKNTWHWKTDYPTATYLYSFSVTNYNRFQDSYNWGGPSPMPLEFFIYPGSDTTTNRNAWRASVQMLATFRPIFGLYPFINEKYGIYQFGFGGGMEHQTMTGQGSFGESLTAHELAHQWWGDMITCAKWNDIWLNEGFATYGEALWLERKPGSTGLPALHSAMAARRPSTVAGTIYKAEPLNVGDINLIFSTASSYRKPAWVLHMLRRIVGDATFFQILAEYRAQFEYKSALTTDFINVVNGVVGRDMNWFFQPWIYQPGAPAYQTAWQNQTINGQPHLAVFVRQSQTTSYPTYSMPIDLVVTIGGTPTTLRIWNDAREDHYLIPTTGAATAVALDPTPWVLATANTTTTFVQGPPRVLSVSPAPATGYTQAQLGSFSVAFSRNVTIPAGAITLTSVGAVPVSIPVSVSYVASTFTATITPTAPIPAGNYTLTISDQVRDASTNQQLDGERTDPANFLVSPGALTFPTGNGAAGGSTALAYGVAAPAPCVGDADNDGVVNFSDITSVLANFGLTNAGPGQGDADVSGSVDFSDVTSVLANFGSDCP